MTFEEFESALVDNNMKKSEFAEIIGVSPHTISSWGRADRKDGVPKMASVVLDLLLEKKRLENIILKK